MRVYKKIVFGASFFLCLLCSSDVKAGDSAALIKVMSYPDKVFGALDKRAGDIQAKIDKQTNKYLSKLLKAEKKLCKNLMIKDSMLAQPLFGNIDKRYTELRNFTDKSIRLSNTYLPHLDSITTALLFLKRADVAGQFSEKQVTETLQKFNSLQERLNQTDQIRKYLNERQQLLKEQLERFGMLRQLKIFRKQVYYYRAQIAQYKAMIEDPSKFEEKLMETVMNLPQFQAFFARNSALSSIFAFPGSGSSSSRNGIQALPSRAVVTQAFSNHFGGGKNVSQSVQQNIQAAQGEVSDLQSKITSITKRSYGNVAADFDTPHFKPNSQKTKTLRERFEYGTNLQTQRSTRFFPTTSDIALSFGYKLNDKSILGIGASYKVGWGQNIQNIRISSEGIGFRSFADLKLKGSFYASGGFEYNFQKPFTTLQQLYPTDNWQESGLVGMSKIISLKTAFFKKSKIQVLWDFLSYRQRPQAQPLKFRIGYSF